MKLCKVICRQITSPALEKSPVFGEVNRSAVSRRSGLTRTITKTPPPPPPGEDKPFYGWRYLNRVRPDGKVEVEKVLLTLEDVLHPQEDDVIPENSVHEAERRYLSDLCHARQHRLDQGLVFSDCIVDWGVAGLGNHSPDISVFA